MTWVVAKQIYSGYIVLFSDIQVTWKRGGRTLRKDCLKKVYPISGNIAAGFSGSVEIGFHVLSDLCFYVRSLQKKGEKVIPRKVAHNWHRRARRVFDGFSQEHQRNGCSIIMGGISPGNSVVPRTDIVVFNSKNRFTPKYVEYLQAASIGSGNSVESYVEFLEATNDVSNMDSLFSGEPVPGIGGSHMALIASIIMQEKQAAGVSKHVHCTLVGNGGLKQFPVNYFSLDRNDNKKEIVMPKVAETYYEFRNMEKRAYGGVGQGCAI